MILDDFSWTDPLWTDKIICRGNSRLKIKDKIEVTSDEHGSVTFCPFNQNMSVNLLVFPSVLVINLTVLFAQSLFCFVLLKFYSSIVCDDDDDGANQS